MRKQPPRGGRGAFGREKNPAVENVKRKSAVRSQRATFLAGGGGGEEKLFDGWGGKRSKRWKTAAGARRREECEIATKGISLADGRGRLMTSMVEEFFPPEFFKIVAEFSKISRGIARRRRDYYLKPGKCEWLG